MALGLAYMSSDAADTCQNSNIFDSIQPPQRARRRDNLLCVLRAAFAAASSCLCLVLAIHLLPSTTILQRDDRGMVPGLEHGFIASEQSCNHILPPNYCAEIGGAILHRPPNLWGYVPQNRRPPPVTEPRVCIAIFYANSLDPGFRASEVRRYTTRAQLCFAECLRDRDGDERPVDMSVMADCIWDNMGNLAEPRGLLLAGNSLLFWLGSREGGLVLSTIEVDIGHDSRVNIVMLLPRPELAAIGIP